MKFAAGFAALCLMATGELRAATVFGGTLLTQTNAEQIETWLGESNLAFTNIFSSSGASFDASAFHAAADYQGRTITVYQVTLDGSDTPILIGGYNPLSWNSISGWHFSLTDAERIAFIFNLSTNTIQRQNLIGQGLAGSEEYQTYNVPNAGPAFGGGHDIAVYSGGSGFLRNDGYGGTSFGMNIGGAAGESVFTLNHIETFTLSETPEPTTAAMFCLAALGIALGKFLKSRAQPISH